jgi:hypothetical protein
MIFVPALVGAFLPQTLLAKIENFRSLTYAREIKKHPNSQLEKGGCPDVFFPRNYIFKMNQS